PTGAGRSMVRRRGRGHGVHGLDLLGDPRREADVLPARDPLAGYLVDGPRGTGKRAAPRRQRSLRGLLQPVSRQGRGDRMPPHHPQPRQALRIPSRSPPQPQPADGTDGALSPHSAADQPGRGLASEDLGAANYPPTFWPEIGNPEDERHPHRAAVEKIVELAALRARLGDVYHTSP